MDFQDGGSYFQNSLSNDNFTFVSCNPDFAYNVFVDPAGDQLLCSDTNLTPDDTNQLSTCPIQKSQLYSGLWSILILSNNGDGGDPIGYERDFSLSVGPQSTSTYTPTVVITVLTTPVVTTTTTTTDTSTTEVKASTVTTPSITITPTTTVTPARVTTTTTKALLTLKFTAYSLDISQVTKTKTASCRTPTRPSKHDPTCKIKPTVGPAATVLSSKFRREIAIDKAALIKRRNAKIYERAPDPQPLVVTDTNTDEWSTTTSTSTAAALTATSTVTASATTTVTPAPITVAGGKATAAIVTTTAPTPTRTVTKLIAISTSITTKTVSY
ncbi:hypothetical protein P154DRAFT_463582, partial [Amniculicola lignicola CBS 123094]